LPEVAGIRYADQATERCTNDEALHCRTPELFSPIFLKQCSCRESARRDILLLKLIGAVLNHAAALAPVVRVRNRRVGFTPPRWP
jgi:hypothetical protein